MLSKRRHSLLLMIAVGLAVTSGAEVCSGQTLQYPPYGSWRGRAVARQGLFHVQRYRWGSGLTPTGGAFLTSAVESLAPVLPVLVGRDEASRSGAGRPLSSRDDYVRELRRANDLLERTQQLLTNNPTEGAEPVDPPSDGRLTPEEIEQRYGTNPW